MSNRVAPAARTYAATYGGQACTATTTDGRYFTVLLDVDPGHGSMVFSKIHATQVVLHGEIVED